MTPQEQESYKYIKQELKLPDEEAYKEYRILLNNTWQDKTMTLEEILKIIEEFIIKNPLPLNIMASTDSEIKGLIYMDYISEAVREDKDGKIRGTVRREAIDDFADMYMKRLDKAENKTRELFEISKENFSENREESIYESIAKDKVAKKYGIELEDSFLASLNGAKFAYLQEREIEEIIS